MLAKLSSDVWHASFSMCHFCKWRASCPINTFAQWSIITDAFRLWLETTFQVESLTNSHVNEALMYPTPTNHADSGLFDFQRC